MKSPNDKNVRMTNHEVGGSRQFGQEVKAAEVEGAHIPFEGQSEKHLFSFPAYHRSVEATSLEEAQAKLQAELAQEKANTSNE